MTFKVKKQQNFLGWKSLRKVVFGTQIDAFYPPNFKPHDAHIKRGKKKQEDIPRQEFDFCSKMRYNIYIDKTGDKYMDFDIDKVTEANTKEWRGEYNKKYSDEELIAAINSGLFTSKAAIARYFNVSTTSVYARIKKLRAKGIIKGESNK